MKFEIDNHPIYGFYITEGNHPSHYLHKDGLIRYSTYNEDTQSYDGYYKTREEAQSVIDALPSVGYSIFSKVFDAIFGKG